LDRPIPELTVSRLLDALAASTPTPGGGSVTALAGAMAAALAAMIFRVALARPAASGGVSPEQQGERLRQGLQDAEALRQELAQLATADALAYAAVLDAYRLPRDSAAEQAARTRAIQSALRKATATPLEIAERLHTLLAVLRAAADARVASAQADVAVGTLLAQAALQGVALTAQANLPTIEDTGFRATVQSKLDRLIGPPTTAEGQFPVGVTPASNDRQRGADR